MGFTGGGGGGGRKTPKMTPKILKNCHTKNITFQRSKVGKKPHFPTVNVHKITDKS